MESRFFQSRVAAARRRKRPSICKGCPGNPLSEPHNPFYSGGFVPSSGPLDAPLLVAGISGGEEEEDQGKVLCGPSGRKLNHVIQWAAEELGCSSLPVRKCNVYGCRATQTGYGGKIINRKSGSLTVKEMRACSSRWLFPELRRTKAKVVLLLGTEAYNFVMNKRFDVFGKAMGHRLPIPQARITPDGLGDYIYSFGEEIAWGDFL